MGIASKDKCWRSIQKKSSKENSSFSPERSGELRSRGLPWISAKGLDWVLIFVLLDVKSPFKNYLLTVVGDMMRKSTKTRGMSGWRIDLTILFIYLS